MKNKIVGICVFLLLGFGSWQGMQYYQIKKYEAKLQAFKQIFEAYKPLHQEWEKEKEVLDKLYTQRYKLVKKVGWSAERGNLRQKKKMKAFNQQVEESKQKSKLWEKQRDELTLQLLPKFKKIGEELHQQCTQEKQAEACYSYAKILEFSLEHCSSSRFYSCYAFDNALPESLDESVAYGSLTAYRTYKQICTEGHEKGCKEQKQHSYYVVDSSCAPYGGHARKYSGNMDTEVARLEGVINEKKDYDQAIKIACQESSLLGNDKVLKSTLTFLQEAKAGKLNRHYDYCDILVNVGDCRCADKAEASWCYSVAWRRAANQLYPQFQPLAVHKPAKVKMNLESILRIFSKYFKNEAYFQMKGCTNGFVWITQDHAWVGFREKSGTKDLSIEPVKKKFQQLQQQLERATKHKSLSYGEMDFEKSEKDLKVAYRKNYKSQRGCMRKGNYDRHDTWKSVRSYLVAYYVNYHRGKFPRQALAWNIKTILNQERMKTLQEQGY